MRRSKRRGTVWFCFHEDSCGFIIYNAFHYSKGIAMRGAWERGRRRDTKDRKEHV
jgi:hypothetical protein